MSGATDKFDELVHRLHESPLLPGEQLLNRVQKLFPNFNPDPSTHIYDTHLTEYVIEQYAYGRSLGMDIKTAAHTAELSGYIIEHALEGRYVSLETFGKLVKAELFALAEMHQTHLKKLATESEKGNFKATLAFLEKVFPEHYTPKTEVSGVIEHKFTEVVKSEMKDRIKNITDKGSNENADSTDGKSSY